MVYFKWAEFWHRTGLTLVARRAGNHDAAAATPPTVTTSAMRFTGLIRSKPTMFGPCELGETERAGRADSRPAHRMKNARCEYVSLDS